MAARAEWPEQRKTVLFHNKETTKKRTATSSEPCPGAECAYGYGSGGLPPLTAALPAPSVAA